MKCKDCNGCVKGLLTSRPNDYVCIGAKDPFVIDDINMDCPVFSQKLMKRNDLPDNECGFMFGDKNKGVHVGPNALTFFKNGKGFTLEEILKNPVLLEGCEFCDDDYNQEIQCYSVRHHNNGGATIKPIETKFCPSCGRRIK